MKNSFRSQIPAFVLAKIVMNTTVRMVYPFLHAIAAGLGVDLTVVSRIIALRSMMGGLGPFLASIAERRGRKTGMVGALLLFSLGCGLMAIYPSVLSFVLAMVLTILGNLIFIPSMQAYVGDHISYERRGRALALTETGWSLAFIGSIPLMSLLMDRYGWASPFPVLAVAALVMAAVLSWMLPSDRPAKTQSPNILRNLGSVFVYPPALAGLLLGFSTNAGNEVVNLVFGVWIGDSFGLSLAGLGGAAAVIGFSELGGELLSSAIVDRLGKRRSIAIGLLLNSIIAVSLYYMGSTMGGALVGLALFYLTLEFTLVSSLPLMTEIMPHARATLLALNIGFFALGRAAGDLLAPILYDHGILASGIAAAAFNMIALLALRKAQTVKPSVLETGQEQA